MYFSLILYILGYIDCPELTAIIYSNYEYWKEKLADETQTGVRLTFTSGSTYSVSTLSAGSGCGLGQGGNSITERPGRLHTVQELGSDDLQSPSAASDVLSDPLKSSSAVNTPMSEDDTAASVPLLDVDENDVSSATDREIGITLSPSTAPGGTLLAAGGSLNGESWQIENLKDTTIIYKDNKKVDKRDPVCV